MSKPETITFGGETRQFEIPRVEEVSDNDQHGAPTKRRQRVKTLHEMRLQYAEFTQEQKDRIRNILNLGSAARAIELFDENNLGENDAFHMLALSLALTEVGK